MVHDLPFDAAVAAVPYTLTDTARLWFNSERGTRKFKTWSQFTHAFKARFVTRDTDSNIIKELMRRTQGRQPAVESINAFLAGLVSTYRLSYATTIFGTDVGQNGHLKYVTGIPRRGKR